MEYQATSAISASGHRVRRLPNTASEQVGTIPASGKIRLTEIKDGWGKLDKTTSAEMVGTRNYRPFNWETEGWTMVSGNEQAFFLPITLAPRIQQEPVLSPAALSAASGSSRGSITTNTATAPILQSYSASSVTSSSSGKIENSSDGPSALVLYSDNVTASSPYYTYQTTSIISRSGMNVRRYPSTTSEVIGKIEFDGICNLTHIRNGWGKLHPNGFLLLNKPSDLTKEGWVVMAISGSPSLQPVIRNVIAPNIDNFKPVSIPPLPSAPPTWLPTAPPSNTLVPTAPLPSAPPIADITPRLANPRSNFDTAADPPVVSYNPSFVQISNLGVVVDDNDDIIGIQQALAQSEIFTPSPTAPSIENGKQSAIQSNSTVNELLAVLKATLVATSTLKELKEIEEQFHAYHQMINQRKVSLKNR